MKVRTVLAYLFGSRRAILDVARSPWAPACGGLLVLSAALAREYDGADLVHEPWQALAPLGASLVSGTLLFAIVHGAALVRRDRAGPPPPALRRAWCSFMGLFWMTAPLAWLYAVPYERFVSPAGAVEANLWTLATVAAWRVILITRAISVVYGMRAAPVFFLVMVFADAVALAAISLVPAPIIDVMGGIRHTPEDALVAGVTLSVTVCGVLSAPVWLIAALAGLQWLRPTWAAWIGPAAATAAAAPPRGVLAFAVLSIAAWVPAIVICQGEQVNRRAVERLFSTGDTAAALRAMSAHGRDHFPPHWNPPPRLGWRDRAPDLAEVRSAMRAEPPADWVSAVYVAKMRRELLEACFDFRGEEDWPALAEHVAERGADGWRPRDGTAEIAVFLLEFDATLREADREALERLRAILANEKTPP